MMLPQLKSIFNVKQPLLVAASTSPGSSGFVAGENPNEIHRSVEMALDETNRACEKCVTYLMERERERERDLIQTVKTPTRHTALREMKMKTLSSVLQWVDTDAMRN